MGRKREPLNADGQRVYARLVADVARELASALAREGKLGTITRAELARRLGRDKAFVSRKLSGGENMELRTIAAFLAALGYEMDVKAERLAAAPGEGRNIFPEIAASSPPRFTVSADPRPNAPAATTTVGADVKVRFSHAA